MVNIPPGISISTTLEGRFCEKDKNGIIRKSNNLFILTDYNSNSFSMGINFEAELMRDLAVKSATP